MRFSTKWLSAIVAFLLLGPVPGMAQQAPPEKGAATESTKDDKQSKRRRPPKNLPRADDRVEELEGIEVLGRIQKPEVFYVLGRTDFAYKGLSLKKSFVDRIGRSVRSNPF